MLSYKQLWKTSNHSSHWEKKVNIRSHFYLYEHYVHISPDYGYITFVLVPLIFCAALTILSSALPSKLFWIWIQPSQVTKQTSCRIMASGITLLHNIIKSDGKLESECSLFMKIQHQVSNISIVSKLPICMLAFWYICFQRIQTQWKKNSLCEC